jgi:hypothetical protein
MCKVPAIPSICRKWSGGKHYSRKNITWRNKLYDRTKDEVTLREVDRIRLRRPILSCVEAELRGDHHLVPHGLQRFTDHLLVGEGVIHLGGVDEADATVRCGADQRDPFTLRDRSGIAEVQPHAAKPNG